jgi:pimeloyl-ACP methyl ester carboxylesterase
VLRYDRFVAHGSDIGVWVANRLAIEYPERVLGLHVTGVRIGEPGARPPTAAEQAMLAEDEHWERESGAYSHLQETRPATPAYGLTDSPAGLAGWIVEKLHEWSDLGPTGDFERVWSKERTLTLLTLYWATNSIPTSFLPYFERPHDPAAKPWRRPSVPAAVAMFPRGLVRAPREWAERGYERLVRWTDMPRGGHFPAVEAVDLLADDIRAAVRTFGLG